MSDEGYGFSADLTDCYKLLCNYLALNSMRLTLFISIIAVVLVLSGIGCNVPTVPSQQSASPPVIETASTDLTITIGSLNNLVIEPLLGVNIGPIPSGTDPRNADLTTAYKEIGVTLIRTHDYYGALDMSLLYPDRTKDPSDPRSYNFASSDETWKAIIDGGFEPYFRLGDSWNDAKPPANALERSNWVKAAIEVLRHYRTGRWNGFNTSFRYVEIWNEPDNQQFWSKPHTPLEYFQLYHEAAVAIKQQFPGVMVGGPAVTQAAAMTPQGKKWTQDFLDFVRQKNAPLDFFSWHMYSNSPQEYAEAANFYRSLLDARGFTQTTIHITEWNTDIKRGADDSPEALALRTGSRGAAILTAAWIELQHNDVEVSTIYRGPDPDIKAPTFYGLFYADGRPKRSALAFSLWSKMTLYPQQVSISAPSYPSLWMLAGQNDAGNVALIIANTGDKPVSVGISFADQRRINKISLYRVSDASDEIQTSTLNSPIFELDAYSVQLMTFE
jgi:hypothetical protein